MSHLGTVVTSLILSFSLLASTGGAASAASLKERVRPHSMAARVAR